MPRRVPITVDLCARKVVDGGNRPVWTSLPGDGIQSARFESLAWLLRPEIGVKTRLGRGSVHVKNREYGDFMRNPSHSKELDIPHSAELLNDEFRRLQEESQAYAHFCADLGNAARLKITIGANVYYFILLKAVAVIVATSAASSFFLATADTVFTPGVSQTFYTAIELIQVTNDPATLAAYINALYIRGERAPKNVLTYSGSTRCAILDLSTSTINNQRDLWRTYKWLWYETYVDSESLPITPWAFDPVGALPDEGSLLETEYDPAGRSLTTWAEMPGVYTAYVDNVGVFLPVGYPIDGEMTSQLETGEPWIMDYVYCKRNPNAGVSQDLGLVQGLVGAMGMIPGIGPAIGIGIGGAVSGIAYARYIWPRLRAFGRQTTPAPSYSEYSRELARHGVTSTGREGNPFSTGNQKVFKISEPEYEEFIGKLESYNVIPSRGGS